MLVAEVKDAVTTYRATVVVGSFSRLGGELWENVGSSRPGSGSRRSGGRKRKDACGGRGQPRQDGRVGSTSFLATLSELRGGGSGLVSRLPSGEGGCRYSPGRFWTALPRVPRYPARYSARVIARYQSMSYYRSLSSNLPSAPWRRNTCSHRGPDRVQYSSSSVRHGAPILHLGLFPSSCQAQVQRCLGKRGMCGAIMSC